MGTLKLFGKFIDRLVTKLITGRKELYLLSHNSYSSQWLGKTIQKSLYATNFISILMKAYIALLISTLLSLQNVSSFYIEYMYSLGF